MAALGGGPYGYNPTPYVKIPKAAAAPPAAVAQPYAPVYGPPAPANHAEVARQMAAEAAAQYLRQAAQTHQFGVDTAAPHPWLVVPKMPTPKSQPKSTPTKKGAKAPDFNPNPVKNMTPAQYLTEVMALSHKLGTGIHVPGNLSLSRLADMVNALPTSPNMPGAFSLANIAKAARGGKGTPGYVDPMAAAAAAAQQQYGGAVSADQLAVTQQAAQNTQNLEDIQNWYKGLVAQEQANAADDTAGYNAAITGTGNLGTVSNALGFAPGSAGADTIDQTGSILNAAARMGAASGEQLDRNLILSSGQAGLQAYQNQKNKDTMVLQQMRDQLNQDLKSKGAAYVTAQQAAQQANRSNANDYANVLSGLNNAYNQNWENILKAKTGKIGTLAGLNSQYVAQGINAIKTRLAALNTAGAFEAMPGQTAAVNAKVTQSNARAYESYVKAQTDKINAQTKAAQARLKAQGTSLVGNTPASARERYKVAGEIYKTINADPKVFKKDPLTGAVTLKNKKLAIADIQRMIALAGLNPAMGAGASIDSILRGMVLGYA